MARRVRSAVLDSRAARERLKVRPEPHWCALTLGLHLGYRRRRTGGSWVARRRLDSGGYQESGLGLADDHQNANGKTVLDFSQAQTKARGWYDEAVVDEPAEDYLVKAAMTDYMAHYTAEGGKAERATQSAIDAHIVPKLGALKVSGLTRVGLKAWHRGLATAAPRVRSRKSATSPKHRPITAGDDAKRKRKATANRVLTILKAGLNLALAEGKATSETAWKHVKPFRGVDAPVIRYLTGAESIRVVNGAVGSFRDLVRAALLTGCRYSELTRLRAGDVNLDVGTVLVRLAKGGEVRHVVLTDEGQRFFAGLVAGKASNAIILLRDDGKPWGKSHQQRPLTEACKRAGITPAASFHVLRHTHGSTLAMKGVPISVISKQLGHADERITSRHYAHLAPSYVSDTIREKFPDLGIVPMDKSVVEHKIKARRG